MSKKKVLQKYPDAECISGWDNGKDVYQIVRYTQSNCDNLSHTCTTEKGAWKSALNWINGKHISRLKGDKPGRKAKISIQLPQADKARIERKHGTVQKFVNYYAAKVK